MELMQDGVVAALAAIGVTALLWLAASVLLVDCGLDEAGRRAVSLLAGDNVKLVTPEELAALYTEK